MSQVDMVTVSYPKFPAPKLLSQSVIGSRSGPSKRSVPAIAWEYVEMTGKPNDIKPTLEQVGKCWFVKDLAITVPFTLEYMIAQELEDYYANATTNNDIAVKNYWHQVLMRIKLHAKMHYDQYVDIIDKWAKEVSGDLLKKLPTKKHPTSSSDVDIGTAIGTLITDWMAELEYRLKQKTFEHDQADYQLIKAQMDSMVGVPVFMPNGFALPPKPAKPKARQAVSFLKCRH